MANIRVIGYGSGGHFLKDSCGQVTDYKTHIAISKDNAELDYADAGISINRVSGATRARTRRGASFSGRIAPCLEQDMVESLFRRSRCQLLFVAILAEETFEFAG